MKFAINNSKPDLHNINAHTKFGGNPLMFTRYYPETKYGWKDGRTFPRLSIYWVFLTVNKIPHSTLKVPISSLWNKGNSVKKIPNICPFVCPDRHTHVQRETIIPRHYRVAGYENGLMLSHDWKVFILYECDNVHILVSNLLTSTSNRYRTDRNHVGPITVRYRFKKNAIWGNVIVALSVPTMKIRKKSIFLVKKWLFLSYDLEAYTCTCILHRCVNIKYCYHCSSAPTSSR